MRIRAAFIGINEYQDLSVDNLSGARPDAVLLDALFRDSVVGTSSSLLLDGQATRAKVEATLHAVSHGATVDDTVLVTFSGHGSTDGLFLHDSLLADPSTMLSMDDVAAWFRGTKAGQVLVLLDCCESGEGPRRVLRSSSDPSGMDGALHSSAGGGRVMIAAANPLQSAWESSSVAGHGLLTASLVDVLSRATGPVDVRELSAAISERVRAEAARRGDEQIPVDISIVAGGFTLPPLRPGSAYQAAFPDRSTVVVKGFSELIAFEIPQSIANGWDAEYTAGLNQLQLAAINDHRLLDGRNLLVVAPTGSGKTLLGELAAIRAVSSGKRAVFLVPLVALAAEKHEEFLERYGQAHDLRVIRCTGDSTDRVPQFLRGKYDIALLTYEMFLSLVLNAPTALSHIGTVVVDEAHFVTDPERGINLELLLTLLVARRADGAAPQLVALSAVIGKVNHFDDWLGAQSLVRLDRPVPLTEGVLDRTGVYQYLDTDGSEKQLQMVPRHLIQIRGASESAQDVLVPLARTLLGNETETLLVFRNEKGKTAGSARYLGELGLPPASGALASLPALAASSDSEALRRCLERGTGFHNANLIREERTAVERAFRDARELRALTATTTLAAGINTPATTVVIVEHQFPGKEPRDFTVAEYKNMAGRAGRPGFAPVGRSILYASTPIERSQLFRKYVRGEPEGVRSSFKAEELDTWLIRLLRQARKIPPDKVVGLLCNTFGGYAMVRQDPAWQGRMERDLGQRLGRMRDLGLVQEHRGFLFLTKLGEACGQSSLSLDSCMNLVEILKRQGITTMSDLMVLIQALDELDGAFMPLVRANKKGTDRGWASRLGTRVPAPVVRELALGAIGDDHERRCKRALLALDWVSGMSVANLEKGFTANPYSAVTYGTIRSTADNTRFRLRSAADVARAVFEGHEFPEEDLETLLLRLEFGLPPDLLDLAAQLPWLMREEILALSGAGIGTLESIRQAPEGSVQALLRDKVRSQRLLEAAQAAAVAPT